MTGYAPLPEHRDPALPGPDTCAAQHHPLPASGPLRSRSSRPRLLAGAALAAIAAVFIAVDRETGIPATAAAVAETTASADGQLPAATASRTISAPPTT